MKKLIYVAQAMILGWCCFVAVDAYCHWHFDFVSPVDLYQIDKEKFDEKNGGEMPYISFNEWKTNEDKKDRAIWQEIGYQCAESFDPWYDRNDHRDISPAEAQMDHGRD